MPEKYKPLFIRVLYGLAALVLVSGILYLSYRFMILVLPFVIAYLFSSALEPAIRFIIRLFRDKLGRKPVAAVVTAVFIAIFGFAVTLLVIRLIRELTGLYRSAAEYYQIIYNALSVLLEKIQELAQDMPAEVADTLSQLLRTISQKAGAFLQSVIGNLIGFAGQLPAILLFIFVTILATFFMVMDRHTLAAGIRKLLTEKTYERMNTIRVDLLSALGAYLRAMALIMTVTFTELAIGFSLIGLRSAAVLALVISLVDILPVFGAGTVLIPWMGYELITGNTRLGLSLLAVHAVVWLVRQIIEPRIVGSHIGVPPVVTLFSMYLGFRLIGVTGMFLGPLAALTIKSFYISFHKMNVIPDQPEI